MNIFSICRQQFPPLALACYAPGQAGTPCLLWNVAVQGGRLTALELNRLSLQDPCGKASISLRAVARCRRVVK